MAIVQNPQEYDKKLPTNVRLAENLKTLTLEEAKRREVTLAQVINEALEERYKVRMEEEQTDGSSNTQSRMGQ